MINDRAAKKAEELLPWTVEHLSAILHEVYQKEAHRRGDVRHPDDYNDLSEATKEWDRVLARWILDLRPAVAAALREAYADCKDCCCARSWKALGGQTIKNGGIVEHIEALQAEIDKITHDLDQSNKMRLEHLKSNESLRAELREAYAEIARLRAALQKAAGFKVDRCACVFIDDEPSLECAYHKTLRAELAKVKP